MPVHESYLRDYLSSGEHHTELGPDFRFLILRTRQIRASQTRRFQPYQTTPRAGKEPSDFPMAQQ